MTRLPKTMRAIEIKNPGGPEVMKVTQAPLPKLADGEVLIAVDTAGVNRPDIMQRTGMYPPPPGASPIPGLEVSGTIVTSNSKTEHFNVGDKVCALVSGGGYAEYAKAPFSQCLPIPKNVTIKEAGSLPETYFTVWTNVFNRANLSPGESILIHGGSSGIGTTAIQICNALGHRVFATVGSEKKRQPCMDLGARHVINYNSEQFENEILNLTDNRGVDVILDMVGGSYLQRNLNCLADDGRLSIIAFLGGIKANLDMTDILKRRLTITGSTLRPRSSEFKGKIAASLLEHVWPLFDKKLINPVVCDSFTLEEVSAAHSLMESSDHVGKIVLEVGCG